MAVVVYQNGVVKSDWIAEKVTTKVVPVRVDPFVFSTGKRSQDRAIELTEVYVKTPIVAPPPPSPPAETELWSDTFAGDLSGWSGNQQYNGGVVGIEAGSLKCTAPGGGTAKADVYKEFASNIPAGKTINYYGKVKLVASGPISELYLADFEATRESGGGTSEPGPRLALKNGANGTAGCWCLERGKINQPTIRSNTQIRVNVFVPYRLRMKLATDATGTVELWVGDASNVMQKVIDVTGQITCPAIGHVARWQEGLTINSSTGTVTLYKDDVRVTVEP